MSEQIHNSRAAKRALTNNLTSGEASYILNAQFLPGLEMDRRASNIGEVVASGIYNRLAPIFGTDEDVDNAQPAEPYVENLAEIDRLNAEPR